jgi:hypothetical protein
LELNGAKASGSSPPSLECRWRSGLPRSFRMRDENGGSIMLDITVENHGSIFLFRPESDAGKSWLEDNTDGQWFGNALAVEHRFAYDLAQGALNDGLEVE